MNGILLLGKLERVELRDVWKNEAGDFTPWLAKEENIAILGETIGRELEVEAQEQNVGPFKADILCKDTTDDHFVLIENQLEKTNHGHMGQLITYAAGLKAATIVWIAERFTEEHRAALDWLNEITGEDFNFFGLEIELWKIGNSLAAPKFNVVSKPNDWTAFVSGAKKGLSDSELTETKRLQLEYWTKLWELLDQNYPDIRGTKPRPQHWNNFSIGRSKFGLHSSVNTQKRFIRIGISCKGPNAEAHFELLKKQKEQIEAEIGEKLEWEDLPHRKECRISIRQFDVDPTKKLDWPMQHQWIAQQLAKFRMTFQHRIKFLSANDYEPDDEPIE